MKSFCGLIVPVPSLQDQRIYSVVIEKNLYVAVMAVYFTSTSADKVPFECLGSRSNQRKGHLFGGWISIRISTFFNKDIVPFVPRNGTLVLVYIPKGGFRLLVPEQCWTLIFILTRITSLWKVALLLALDELDQNNVAVRSRQSHFYNIQNHKPFAVLGLSVKLACQRLHKLKGYFVQKFLCRISFSGKDSSSLVFCKDSWVGGFLKSSLHTVLACGSCPAPSAVWLLLPAWHLTARLLWLPMTLL